MTDKMEEKKYDLAVPRALITEIDREMARLFRERMAAVGEVAEVKRHLGLPVLDEVREAELLRKNTELFDDDELRSYYAQFLKNNMALSREYQHRLLDGMRVAYCGVPGAFAHIAATRLFPTAKAVSHSDFKSTYESVVSGACDCTVLPIENSFAGDVTQVVDYAHEGPLFINGVYELEVVHCLLGNFGTKIGDIRRVVSHPQAHSQCAGYIGAHGFETEDASNTAAAARALAESGAMDTAVIASAETAELYGLSILDKRINESNVNTTRFAVFSREQIAEGEQHTRFILFFTVKNEAGALSRAISIIGDHGFNLRALKSRPTKGANWEYYFYTEGEGNLYSGQGMRMLVELGSTCSEVKVVGSFAGEKKI